MAPSDQGKLLAATAFGWRNGREQFALARANLHLQRSIVNVSADFVGNTLSVIKRRTVVEMGDSLLIEETFLTAAKIEEI